MFWFNRNITNDFLKPIYIDFTALYGIFWIFLKILKIIEKWWPVTNPFLANYIYGYFSRFWTDFDQIKFILSLESYVLSNLTVIFSLSRKKFRGALRDIPILNPTFKGQWNYGFPQLLPFRGWTDISFDIYLGNFSLLDPIKSLREHTRISLILTVAKDVWSGHVIVFARHALQNLTTVRTAEQKAIHSFADSSKHLQVCRQWFE